jgi:hypothetical protein
MKMSTKLSKQRTILLSVLVITSTFVATGSVHRSAGLTQTPATFTNYELAGNEFIAGHSQGVTCPNGATDPTQKCYSTQAEPAIRADPAGNFYGSSESVFCVIAGQCGGTYAWKSTDGGSHFATLALPNTVTVPPTAAGASPQGGDTDLAVAPVKNTNGFYNVYVASLHATLASIGISVSSNGGASWLDNTFSASIPVDDREWVAADGPSKICLSYHAFAATNAIVVDCGQANTATGAIVFTTHASAFDGLHSPLFVAYNNKIGNLAIDRHNHLIYQVFSSVSDLSEVVPCATGCNFHTVWVAVSIDGGTSFKDYIVYNDPTGNSDFGHSFVNISVDKGGNLYAVYSDDHNLFYSYSRTFGQSWNGPFKINQAPSNTAIFPWSSAGNTGQIDVVWYGTSYANGAQVPTNFPPYPSTAATWYVYFAQNLNALTPNSPFTQVAASGVVHYGDVCELGAGCGTGQNRDLLDDFGVATSPTTGKAAIIYTSDQYVNTQLEPANTYGSRHCASNPPGQPTSPAENTVDCSHTDIAIQTGGSTVNQKPHHFEVDDEDFEELDTSNDGGHSPHNEIDITNTGTGAIDKLDIGIGGLPWTVIWNTSAPVQPGQTVVGTSTIVPTGLLLVVGNVYQVTVTATLADGTTETQTVNVIYSLGAGLGL